MAEISTGKKAMRALTRTRASNPGPNQIMSNGATATMGTAWEATRYGATSRSKGRQWARG
jgi:hypothetical protein